MNAIVFFCNCIRAVPSVSTGGAMLDHSPGQVEGVVDEAGSVANGDDLRDTGSE